VINMHEYRGSAASYLNKLNNNLNLLDRYQIDNAIKLIADTWKAEKQIITLGNGGSSLTALHFINDWNKSIFMSTGRSFKGRCLVDNIGLVMSYGNDISFQDIFVEQLKNILNEGDLVLAISGSGNSENVIRAIEYANSNGAVTLGLCGFDGGKLKHVAKNIIFVNVNDMQITEDVHSIFGHIVIQTLCKYYK
jgi:D-sedoheptulose 7-phosphate isomerase